MVGGLSGGLTLVGCLRRCVAGGMASGCEAVWRLSGCACSQSVCVSVGGLAVVGLASVGGRAMSVLWRSGCAAVSRLAPAVSGGVWLGLGYAAGLICLSYPSGLCVPTKKKKKIAYVTCYD